jgi:hypothetical protein
MLDVRRALRARGAEERGVLLGDEGGELRRYRIGKAFLDARGIGLGRTALGLRLLGCGGEDDVGIVHGPAWR